MLIAPQKPFISVIKSAKWRALIMEKCRLSSAKARSFVSFSGDAAGAAAGSA